MQFDSDQDWGPFETLFGAFDGYTVQLTTTDNQVRDARVDNAGKTAVHVTWFKPDDFEGGDGTPTGAEATIKYEEIAELVIY